MVELSQLRRIDARGAQVRADLVQALSGCGLALLVGVRRPDDLRAAAGAVATVVPHRDSRPDGVTVLADREGAQRSGFAGFGRGDLAPHTDRSGLGCPPGLVLLACGSPATVGGESILVDGAAVHADLAATEPAALRALSAPGSALFGGAGGYRGSVFAPGVGGRITVRLRMDDLAAFSPEAAPWVTALSAAIRRHAVELALPRGSGYALDNRRWLHGRRTFSGHRLCYRLLADPLPLLGIPAGFPAAIGKGVAS